MKAIRLRAPASLDNLYLGSAEEAAPQRGEIKVRVWANSVNFRDCIVASGHLPAADDRIMLSDGAGDVVEVGDGVQEFTAGDAVVSIFHPAWQDGHIERSQLTESPGGGADGFACEFVTRAASSFTHAPKGWTHAESATLTCAGVTAWRGLIKDGQLKPGATVLIQGTGGVSIFALQFAKAAGARVIATSSSAEKLQRLKALGADETINHSETPEWGATVLKLTGGLGVDHVIEVGGPNTLAQSMIAARTDAHIAIIGAVAGFAVDSMPFGPIQSKRLRVQGVTVGSRRDQVEMIRALESSRIKPVIDRHFPLEALADALRYQQSRRHFGKVCIDL